MLLKLMNILRKLDDSEPLEADIIVPFATHIFCIRNADVPSKIPRWENVPELFVQSKKKKIKKVKGGDGT